MSWKKEFAAEMLAALIAQGHVPAASPWRSRDEEATRLLREHVGNCALKLRGCAFPRETTWVRPVDSRRIGKTAGLDARVACACGVLTDVPVQKEGTLGELMVTILGDGLPDETAPRFECVTVYALAPDVQVSASAPGLLHRTGSGMRWVG